jgi:hypothetical protein
MMETMIRFTLCNCENCTATYRRPFVCLAWGDENAWLFRKERERELWYKEVAKLLQTSDLVWIYSTLKSIHQILAACFVSREVFASLAAAKALSELRSFQGQYPCLTEYDAV